MADNLVGELIACHECDKLYRYERISAGSKASCHNCGSVLFRHIPNSLNRSLALFMSALILIIIANVFPFLSLELGGRVVENIILSGGWNLYKQGMGELGLLIFFTSFAFPLFVILGMLYLLIPIRLGYVPPAVGPVYRIVQAIMPWTCIQDRSSHYALESCWRFHACRSDRDREITGFGECDHRAGINFTRNSARCLFCSKNQL
jgi:paraquat-inducible protein A